MCMCETRKLAQFYSCPLYDGYRNESFKMKNWYFCSNEKEKRCRYLNELESDSKCLVGIKANRLGGSLCPHFEFDYFLYVCISYYTNKRQHFYYIFMVHLSWGIICKQNSGRKRINLRVKCLLRIKKAVTSRHCPNVYILWGHPV